VASARLVLGDVEVDLRGRALVAAVVPAPRFGRESEVLAAAAAARDARADLVDVSLEPRLLGPAARSGLLPVVARADDVATARARSAAGAAVVLVPPAVAAALAGSDGYGDRDGQASDPTGGITGAPGAAAEPGATDRAGVAGVSPDRAGGPGVTSDRAVAGRAAGALARGGRADDVAIAVVVDDVRELSGAAELAERLGVPLAYDAARRPAVDALAQESAALVGGCRLVRTTDVRRTRRVVEVVAALVDARRPSVPGDPTSHAGNDNDDDNDDDDPEEETA
jgi:hypothetical protein